MNVTKITLSLVTLAVAVSCSLSAHADTQIKQSIGYLEVTSDWPSAAWTNSDEPFLQAERDVNKRIAANGMEVKRNRWMGTHSKSDANAAIANYKRYLALGKPTGKQLRDVEENIQELQKG